MVLVTDATKAKLCNTTNI